MGKREDIVAYICLLKGSKLPLQSSPFTSPTRHSSILHQRRASKLSSANNNKHV